MCDDNYINSLSNLFIVGGVSIAEREKRVSTECGTGF
ncbi:hypothetical protein C5S36_13280 [Candidatus Methanophagaceae archaeon]|nr:hypothetical protein C5S36_13280 [Methanophagales archaeon]